MLHGSVVQDTSSGRALGAHSKVFQAGSAGEAVEVLDRIAAADLALRTQLNPVAAGALW